MKAADKVPKKKGLWRNISYFVQYIAARAVLGFCAILPLSWASGFGAWLFRTIGPHLKADQVARENLARAFPDWDQAKIDQTVTEVWDNLGRGAGEFSQAHKLNPMDPDSPVELVGREHIDAAAKNGKGMMLLSAHMGNWELGGLVFGHAGYPINAVYRWADNPWMDRYFRRMRGMIIQGLIPKGPAGAREMFSALKRNEPIGLLIDQKLNEGDPVPFFGRDAMTAVAGITIALRVGSVLLPVRHERIGKTRYRTTVYPPLTVEPSGDHGADSIAITKQFHALLEDWIRERPGQWFWVHRRWPKD